MSCVMVTWHCELPEEKAEEFLAAFPVDVDINRPSRLDAGTRFINVTVLDMGTSSEAAEGALEFLRSRAAVLQWVTALGGTSEINFGALVGIEESFAPSVAFEPELLRAAIEANVMLRVSCYPTL